MLCSRSALFNFPSLQNTRYWGNTIRRRVNQLRDEGVGVTPKFKAKTLGGTTHSRVGSHSLAIGTRKSHSKKVTTTLLMSDELNLTV